jgi:anti-sigma regulatory factor (Ser/Thr protein kinase)
MGMGMGQARWSYVADFVAEAGSVANAREFVRARLLHHRLPYLVADLPLVVSELATNAIIHAQSPFTVTLAGTDRSVLLTVQDGSPERPVQAATSALDTRGRGTFIVSRFSSSWGVTAAVDARHAKAVWAEFDVTPRSSYPTYD